MEELALFIKENILQLIIIISMLSNKNCRRLGLFLALITLLLGYREWIYVGAVISGMIIDMLYVSLEYSIEHKQSNH